MPLSETCYCGPAAGKLPDAGQVTVRIVAGPATIRIAVADTGVGIAADMQPYLFERFTKARRPGLRGEVTTGLGLALCKTIVEWHHGHISVESTVGEGSTFTVEIPRAEYSASSPALAPVPAEALPPFE